MTQASAILMSRETTKAAPRTKGNLKVKGDDKCKGMKEGDLKTEDCPMHVAAAAGRGRLGTNASDDNLKVKGNTGNDTRG